MANLFCVKYALSDNVITSPNLLKALEATVRVHGWRELTQIAQNTLSSPVADPEIIPSLAEFWARTQNDYRDFVGWLRKSAKHPPALTKIPALTSGFLWSWSLSHRDLKLFTKGNKLGAIFLHRPVVIGTEIILLWSVTLLKRTLETQVLSDSDRKILNWLINHLIHFQTGMNYGNYRKDLLIKFLRSTRFLKAHRNRELQVDPEFFSWLNYAISSQHG